MQVDLVLCELSARPFSGPELARRLSETYAVSVGLLADGDEEEPIRQAIQAGAAGLFSAGVSDDEFAAGVAAMLRGYFVISASLARRRFDLVEHQTRESAAAAYRQLSNAEREILLLLGQAVPIESIAASRGTSKKTVRNHIASLYRKLEVRSRADVVLWVARMGLSDIRAAAYEPLPAEGAPASPPPAATSRPSVRPVGSTHRMRPSVPESSGAAIEPSASVFHAAPGDGMSFTAVMPGEATST